LTHCSSGRQALKASGQITIFSKAAQTTRKMIDF
jgi:hypothetical protein